MRLRLLLFLSAVVLSPGAAAQAVPEVVNIENEVLRKYLDDSDYDTSDYSYTNMSKYVPSRQAVYDKPAPVVFSWDAWNPWEEMQLEIFDLNDPTAPIARYITPTSQLSCRVYNLTPGKNYAYLLFGKDPGQLFPVEEGTFFVEGRRRMIRAENMTNIRDFGGLRTEDGRAIRYGRLYRGAALDYIQGGARCPIINENGIAVFRDLLRIGADIDLRSPVELLLLDGDPDNDMTNTLLGEGVEYYNLNIMHFSAIKYNHIYGKAIAQVVDCLSRGLNVYIHCAAGADRAGVLSFLLAAMAGVTENDLARDYEITCLSHGGSALHARSALGFYNYAPAIEYIKTNFPGRTFAEKVQHYLIAKHDVTREQIETLQRILVE